MLRSGATWRVLIVVSVLASPCLAADQQIEAEGFSLKVPDDWEQLEEDKTVLTARTPRRGEDDQFLENVRLVLHDVGTAFTPAQVAARQKSDLGRFKLIGEGEVAGTKGPMQWMAITPKTPKDESDRLVKVDFITTQDNVIVVLSAMAMIDDWENHLPLFKRIAGTLTLPSE